MVTPKDVEWYVYASQTDWDKSGFKFKYGYCSYEVWDGITMWVQCSRKNSERIGRYGFCKQHAKIVKDSMAKYR